ncbi:MAG: AI-2E family transporter [Ignavibacteriota bacterium]
MQKSILNSDSRKHEIYAIPAAIALVVLMGIMLHFISDAFLTFFAALFLANIFVPLIQLLNRKRVPMFISIIIVLVIVAAFLFGLTIVISTTVNSLVEILPKYQQKWENVFLPAISSTAARISPSLESQIHEFNPMSILAPSKLLAAVSSVTALVGSSVLVLLFMLFILASHGQLILKIERAFPPSDSFHLKQMFETIDSRVRKYLLTTLLINTIAGVTMTLSLLFFGVDLALLWGMLTFLLMFIPNIGSIFAISLPLVVAFLQFDTLGTPIALSIVVIITQVLIGSYISPLVLGTTLNLSPLLILISIIFWGWVWGPLGMILGVPITSSLAIIFESIPPLVPLGLLMSSGRERKPPKLIVKRKK